MSKKWMVIGSLFAIVLQCVLGCGGSIKEHAERRRAALLSEYSVGTARRADVQKRRAPEKPDLSETRPDGGWSAATRQELKAYVLASEKRTGKPVESCERYWGPDPDSTLMLGLEYNWFFYDGADVLIDVEWQYHTD